MKKIVFICISLIVIGLSYYIYNDINSNNFDDRSKLTHQTTCFFGNTKSCTFLIWYFSTDEDDFEKLKELCDRTVEVDACGLVAEDYLFGSDKINPDENTIMQAIYYYDRACKTREKEYKSLRPCLVLAKLYEDGYVLHPSAYGTGYKPKIHIKKDLKKSFSYLKFACEYKSEGLCAVLSSNILKGKYDFYNSSTYNKNKLAKTYLRKGCPYEQMSEEEVGKSSSCYNLVKLNIDNKGKSKILTKQCLYSSTQSYSWDHGESCFKNGLLYLEGKGLRQNIKKAKEYFGKACDIGNEDGCSEYIKLNKK